MPDSVVDEAVDDDVVIPNSYRLTYRIMNVVNQEVSHIDKRQETNLEPRKESVYVEELGNRSMLDFTREFHRTVEETEK